MALFPSLYAGSDPTHCSLSDSLLRPSSAHPMGTDLQGCDQLAKAAYGARTSLTIAALVITASAIVATIFGALAGWYGGWVDTFIARTADAVFSIPALIGALFLLSLFDQRSIALVATVLAAFAWPPMVRLVRGAVFATKSEDYVLAARALGASSSYILTRHVIPRSLRPMLAFAAPYAATIVSAEAILSFVGAGLQQPTVSWGTMLADMGSRLGDAPHLLYPGVLLSLLVYALVNLGETLRHPPT